jgi:hypothetical protein
MIKLHTDQLGIMLVLAYSYCVTYFVLIPSGAFHTLKVSKVVEGLFITCEAVYCRNLRHVFATL